MFTPKYFFLFIFVTLWTYKPILSSFQCLDENGNSVDWFVVYKLPKISHEASFVNNGTAYMYITSETVSKGWTISGEPIYSEYSLVGKTLTPIYDANNEGIWFIYNDQDGGSSGEKFGHTKGVIAADKLGGFWLIHSVPKFPPLQDKYSFPKTGYRNGQSMLCITIPEQQVDKLGEVFMFNKPKILEKKIDDETKMLYPNLVLAAKGMTVKKAPWKMFTHITSAEGRQFSNFAKTAKFREDLYEWVAQTFETSILAETWQNEVHPLPSSCNYYQVINVQSIEIQNQSVTFSSHKDHSKWAISKNASKPWVCIGDINRAEPQERRGGGTMCLEDIQLWKAFHNIIREISNCHSHKHRNSSN